MKFKNNTKWSFVSLSLAIVSIVSFAVYNIHKSSKTKELSVILPIYNVESYLPKCLDSLINQSFTNIEIICVNDGSKDNSLEILRDYEQKDQRIIVIDKENGGVSSARNAGIRVSHGKYITFVDPDDYVDTDAYEKCMNRLYETDADILVFDYIVEPDNRQPIKLTDKKYVEPFDAVSDSDISSGFVWNKIFRHSTVINNNIYFKEDINYAEDNLFVNMILTKSKCTVTCPGVLYHYQYHSDSSGNSVPTEKQLANAIKRCSYIIDYYTDEGYTHRYKWILDYCLFITYDYIKDYKEPDKQKYYSTQLLEVLDSKLLPKIDEIPENLAPLIADVRRFASLI